MDAEIRDAEWPDVTDSALEFRGSTDNSGLQIIVTDRVSDLNGKVTTAKGDVTRDYTVVVFADDPAKWAFPSRFVKTGRADQQGQFRIKALPPDDRYLAVAVDYLEDGEAVRSAVPRADQGSRDTVPVRRRRGRSRSI